MTLLAIVFVAEYASFPSSAVAVTEIEVRDEKGDKDLARLDNDSYRHSLGRDTKLTYTLDLDEAFAAYDEPAILISGMRRHTEVRYCGRNLSLQTIAEGPSPHKWFDPFFYIITQPDCADKTLEIIDPVKAKGVSLRKIYVGEAASLKSSYRNRLFFASEAIYISCGHAFLAALIAFAALPLARQRFLFGTFGVLMLFWGGLNFYYLGPWEDLAYKASDILFNMTIFGLFATTPIFVNEWTEKSAFVRRKVGAFLALAFIVLTLAQIVGPASNIFTMQLAGYALGALCVLFALAMLCRSLFKPDSPRFVTFLFLISTWAAPIDMTGFLFPGLMEVLFPQTGTTFTYLPLTSWLAACGMLVYVASENSDIRSALATQNEQLQVELEARENALRQAYAQSEKRERETAILRERQRIMQDVHDGFGGQLLALTIQAESNELDAENLVPKLRESMQDLRLIVDSMDTAGGSLDQALGALRGRIEPQLAQAKIALRWKVDAGTASFKLEPDGILSLYRIIQEICANAIRHSGASELLLSAMVMDDHKLVVEANDNGKGFAAVMQNGKGLENIKRRIAGLNGEVAFESSQAGLKVQLIVPPKQGS